VTKNVNRKLTIQDSLRGFNSLYYRLICGLTCKGANRKHENNLESDAKIKEREKSSAMKII
jgi:hypothetical protein